MGNICFPTALIRNWVSLLEDGTLLRSRFIPRDLPNKDQFQDWFCLYVLVRCQSGHQPRFSRIKFKKSVQSQWWKTVPKHSRGNSSFSLILNVGICRMREITSYLCDTDYLGQYLTLKHVAKSVFENTSQYLLLLESSDNTN